MMNETLGTKVRKLRKKHGMTQGKLAKTIYVSESYIARIEADTRNPSMDVIIRLAELFHVTTDYLVNDTPMDDKKQCVKEWTDLTKDRPSDEVHKALELVRLFFEGLDEKNR